VDVALEIDRAEHGVTDLRHAKPAGRDVEPRELRGLLRADAGDERRDDAARDDAGRSAKPPSIAGPFEVDADDRRAGESRDVLPHVEAEPTTKLPATNTATSPGSADVCDGAPRPWCTRRADTRGTPSRGTAGRR
jgi:hypothetical protein